MFDLFFLEIEMTEKNFELLRPFDLEAAKAGAPILWGGQWEPVTFVGRSRKGKANIIECDGMHAGLLDRVLYAPDDHLRMAPLCWVEGRPVYKGDVLYFGRAGETKTHVADRFENRGIGWSVIWQDSGDGDDQGYVDINYLTWTPPKVKRDGWVNITPYISSGACGEITDRIIRNCNIFPTKQAAEGMAAQCGDVISTIRIEWEEPSC